MESSYGTIDRELILEAAVRFLTIDIKTGVKKIINSIFEEFDKSGVLPFTGRGGVEQNPKAKWNELVLSMR